MPSKINGFIAYQGPSMLDSTVEVMLVVTGITKAKRGAKKGSNTKTGAMVQTYILRTDMTPIKAVKDDRDYAICGHCIHAVEDTCYVRTDTGPTIVYKGVQRNIYPEITPDLGAQLLADLPVRLGTYGDPAVIPYHVWLGLLMHTNEWTGYTHQWQVDKFKAFSMWCMASCDNEEQVLEATAKGWKVYLVTTKVEDTPKFIDLGSVRLKLCPASEEAGHAVTCSDCLGCRGESLKGDGYFIPVHGVTWKQTRYEQALEVA